ncbi:universal stress protein [Kitasatospora aureofaciens]|uniref:Universal stress protein n=1 Tax=Kitasatospora aureofaciens TaxID=1894 RepID=A0A1E7N6Z3_KITAU|nr:universal stress protein [Kitasatospora aureofaciens]OEV36472.1 universal stress protein UspA [Kitasatospora aureofaciens]QEU98374.1 universal stress protein [Streptomyces viridifaciens]UKZ04295.1 universal stress protein [Streptomyces viridifaciens]GGU71815.1 universal stress protein [Kitasatospora aureofaciens]
MSDTPRIVVGVDGSPASEEALRWAVDYARAVGGTVDAVTAWEYPAFYGWGGTTVPPEAYNPEELAGKTLTESVAKVIGQDAGVPIREGVVPGNAAGALLQAAKGAAVLVVGSRGRGGFSGVLLGSVSRHVTEHAPCPVVVVREGHVEGGAHAP